MQQASVVSLGLRPGVEVVNSQRYRIKQGMALQLEQISSENNVTVRGWARVRYDDGTDSLLTIPEFRTSNDPVAVALASPSDVATQDGWVVDALVSLPLDDDVKRGQIYVNLYFDPFGPLILSGYVFSNIGRLALGQYSDPGPGGGTGFLERITVKSNGAPSASTTRSLSENNTIRKVYGFIWYYAAANDAATRILKVEYRNPLGADPTGFAAAKGNVWEPAVLTLTSDEDGCIWANEKRSGANDDGTFAIEDITTAPNPFPILVPSFTQGDPSSLIFSITDSHANDFDAIYLLQESWVVPD